MDSSNYKNVIKLTDNSLFQKKIHFFLDSTFPNKNRQVPDPYFGGKEGFENVFQILNKASEDWIERWKQEDRI
jgi:protein-tyrosine phosphatase